MLTTDPNLITSFKRQPNEPETLQALVTGTKATNNNKKLTSGQTLPGEV